VTGEPVVFTSGDLIDPVRASCAYPGVFLPVSVNGRLMVDGLLGHAVPAKPLREMGADRVAAVYFGAHWVQSSPRHVLEVIGQCFSIAQANMECLWKAHADLLMEPNVSAYAFDDFARSLEMVRIGEQTARELLPIFREWAAQREAWQQYSAVAESPKAEKVPVPASPIQQTLVTG
jgi:NTE family protein